MVSVARLDQLGLPPSLDDDAARMRKRFSMLQEQEKDFFLAQSEVYFDDEGHLEEMKKVTVLLIPNKFFFAAPHIYKFLTHGRP